VLFYSIDLQIWAKNLFFKDKDSTLSGINVAPISEGCAVAILVLLSELKN
jgi:hypothetical protein